MPSVEKVTTALYPRDLYTPSQLRVAYLLSVRYGPLMLFASPEQCCG